MARDPETSKSLDRQIDENLRRIFREKVQEDVPDRFQELLRKLREQDAPK